MAYVKQTWVDHESILDAQHMNHLEDGVATLSDGISDLRDDLNALYNGTESYNLFNVNSEDNVTGAFLHKSGRVSEVAGYIYSHKIPVQAGVNYFIPVNPDLGTDYIAVFYKADDSVVLPEAATKTSDEKYWKFIAPASAVWMRISSDINRMTQVMVVKGDTQPGDSYVPYSAQQGGLIYEQGQKVTAMWNESTSLKGKKLSVNGDSICYGAGASGGYGKIIADRCGMTLENKGVSGATIAANTYGSDTTTPRHWICRTIDTMDADADYVILEGGVNDASTSVALGTLNLANYTAALDDTTFCGAFESMLKQAILRFTKAKIFYLAVHKMTTGFSCNATENSYYHCALGLCKKWGVPVIDLNESVPPLGMYVEDENLVALRNTYTHNGDGWHPNQAGYERFYCDKIIAAMKGA